MCDKEKYFLELVKYIHLNPLKAGIVKNLQNLDTYSWSGHAPLIGNVPNAWQECPEVLSLFNNNPSKYRSFIREGLKSDDEPGNEDRFIRTGPVLGSDEFAEKFRHKVKKVPRTVFSFTEVVKTALDYYGLEENYLKSKSKTAAVSSCRAVIAYFACERLGMSGIAIGENLGLSRSAVSRLVQRGHEIILREKSLATKLEPF